jgi:transposase
MTPEARIAEREAVVAQQREQIGTLLERLWPNQEAVLAFRDDLTISFDSNQAERDLRMLKVQQYVSASFRSDSDAAGRARGAFRRATARSYLGPNDGSAT